MYMYIHTYWEHGVWAWRHDRSCSSTRTLCGMVDTVSYESDASARLHDSRFRTKKVRLMQWYEQRDPMSHPPTPTPTQVALSHRDVVTLFNEHIEGCRG